MNARAPAQPPELAGFKFVRHLGSGGFADVYLYEQQLLGRRNVAVKVLLRGELMQGALDNFTNEATLMATLSNHPSIVSVYQADISPDGRPYIVMEYCSKPTLHARYRAARFSEAEALRVGVQIAAAVETAHRAGILHRDIKPANILVTDYGRPALTDFGIAATTAGGVAGGLSVPWAPPEAFDSDRPGDPRSDVYSLGATLFTLLAGRTPFEIPGASNSTVDLMARIHSAPLPKLGRTDVLASFEKILATALARDPGERYPTAMAFARAMQRVQIERGMQPTTVDVMDDSIDTDERLEDEGRTVVRSVVTIQAQEQAPTAKPSMLTDRPSPPFETAGHHTVLRADSDVVTATQLRPPVGGQIDPDRGAADSTQGDGGGLAATTPDPAQGRRPTRRPLVIAVTGGVTVAVGLGVAGLVWAPRQTVPAVPTASVAPVDPAPTVGAVPKVTNLTGRQLASGKVRFSWQNPSPHAGDFYSWRLVELGGATHPYETTKETSVTVSEVATGHTCIEVRLNRSTGESASTTTSGCAA